MAELPAMPDSGGKAIDRRRVKKMSTRIDFTPMVDLGFLLITFFMLTTLLTKPQVMAVVMPDRKADPIVRPPIPESKVLTLVLGANDRIYWYNGLNKSQPDSTDYSAQGLRQLILDKMQQVEAKWGLETYRDIKTNDLRKGSYLTILIQPSPQARYQNLVDVLDEMAINHIRYYVLDSGC